MPFDPLVTAVVETSFNRLIQDDPELERRLLRLKGQVLQVHLKELNKTLTFVFSHQVDVLADYEGAADCYLSLNLSVLPELREQANITDLIKQDKLDLQGDIQLAQKFSQLLKDCKPDIEEWVSRLTGDVVAHTLIQGVKDVSGVIQSKLARHQSNLAQVLTEEWRIAPPPLEIAYFCDQVEALSSQASRIEKQLDKLLEKA
ncbi:SCP2 domain-containing protein [Vibrio amylolyticus]|uniref:ubiquinone biosynthesis accessory factor UbiJ n=1 Tax=Vibrio amylolyticus TaxID=2847292 RepID=UPI00354D6A01